MNGYIVQTRSSYILLLLDMQVVKELCKEALKAFPESIDDNRAFLKKDANSRAAQIRQIKLQEQRILQRTVFALQQNIKAIS